MHASDLEHCLWKKKNVSLYIYMFFFSFLCPAIPDLDLGILKMLIRVVLQRDVLQPGDY